MIAGGGTLTGQARGKHDTSEGEQNCCGDGGGDEQAYVTLAATELAQQRPHMELPGRELRLRLERDIGP